MLCLCTFLFSHHFSPFSLSLSSPGLVMNLLYSGALFTKTPGPSENQTQSALSIQGIQLPGLLLLKKQQLSYHYSINKTTTQKHKQIPKCKHVLLPFVTQNSKMQYTSLPSYIYCSPMRETRAEGCYCINIGKVKTRVMWRTRSSERGMQERRLNAKLVLWYAIQPVCATNNTGAEWETMMTCQGLMRRGNIYLVKRQKEQERESRRDVVWNACSDKMEEKKTLRWLSDRSIDLYLKKFLAITSEYKSVAIYIVDLPQ